MIFLKSIPRLAADWVYFGTLARPNIEGIQAKRFYDVNLRKDSWTPALVDDLLSQADAVKLNEHELAAIGRNLADLDYESFAITRGARGCTIFAHGEFAEHPGFPAEVADPVGAGDAFAAAFLHGLDRGWPAAKIAEFANRMGAQAVSRAGAI